MNGPILDFVSLFLSDLTNILESGLGRGVEGYWRNKKIKEQGIGKILVLELPLIGFVISGI